MEKVISVTTVFIKGLQIGRVLLELRPKKKKKNQWWLCGGKSGKVPRGKTNENSLMSGIIFR